MLRKILIIAVIMFSLHGISYAEGVVTAVTGTSLVKIPGQEGVPLKEGDVVQEGTAIWIGAFSSLVVNIDGDFVEISAGAEGQDVTFIKLLPLEVAGKDISIKYIGTPVPPHLVSPADGSRALGGSVDLSWSPSQRAAVYRLQISNAPDFSKILLDDKGPDINKKIDKLAKGRYYWRVAAIDKDGGEGGFSNAWSFNVKPFPEPPSVALPASTKTSTTVRWKRRNDDEKYHLQISKNADFSEPTVDLKNIEGPRITVGTLEEGNYFVRISAIDEEGLEGRFSEPQGFYVGPKVPSSNIPPLMIIVGVVFMLLGVH